MQYIDISVSNFTGHFTKNAHAFDVETQILLKVPKFKLTTVRLKGTLFNITEFLRSLSWDEAKVQMHVGAIKDLTPSKEAPIWKNRWLAENRALAS